MTKRRKKKAITTKVTIKKELNINDEIKYIIKCAKNFETKIVALNELILFCTATGDAWLLDTDDNFALNLAREGIQQEYSITDTPYKFSIDWQYNYVIENEKFIFVDKNGVSKAIFGYPIEQIFEMTNKST